MLTACITLFIILLAIYLFYIIKLFREMKTMQEKLTLTVKEAADLIGCSLPTMYNITEREDFTCLVRLGRKKLILKEGLYKWLEQQTGDIK